LYEHKHKVILQIDKVHLYTDGWASNILLDLHNNQACSKSTHTACVCE